MYISSRTSRSSLTFLLTTFYVLSSACSFVAGADSENVEAFPFKKDQTLKPSTLFTEIPTELNGTANFQNAYSNPDFWTKRWHEYLHGAAGAGVAIGDLNGDRLPDFFAVSKDEQNKLYLNHGDFQFLDATESAGLLDSTAFATGCTFADVDNDGDLDIYLCFVRSPNQLWLNDGNAHFQEVAQEWGVAINSGGNVAAFADYDRDGDLDLYLQNNLIQEGMQQLPQADRFFRNIGSHFEDITEAAGIEGQANGHTVTWWDYNDDGWPDLYVANDYMPADKLYRNNQDGTFSNVINETLPLTPFSSMGADFGDINNDGLWDFWGTDMETTDRDKHMQTAGDLVISHSQTKADEAFQYEKNALLVQTGGGHFLDTAYLSGLSSTDWTWAARLADLDNDGWLDAFASNGMVRKLHYKDIGAKGLKISSPYRMAILFKNGPPLNERNFAFRNQGDLTFEDVSTTWGLDKLGVGFGAAFGDLDLDGDLDLIVNNFQAPLSIYRNNESKNNRITISLKGNQSNAFGIGAKAVLHSSNITQTKALYLSRGYLSSDQPILHFGLDESLEVEQLEIHWPSGNYQVFNQLAANKHYVIEEANSPAPPAKERTTLFETATFDLPSSASRTESYFNEFRAQPLLPFSESRLGGRIELGDLNNDQRLDIVMSGSVGQSSNALLNQGDGSFTQMTSFDLEDDFFSEETDLSLTDIDSDGDLDLLIACGGIELTTGDESYANKLYRNNNDTFERDWETDFSTEPLPSRNLAIADFDNDNDQDLFVAGSTLPGKYPHSAESSLWQNDQGRLTKIATLENAGRVSASKWADIDNDGDLDLILAREWDTPAIWLNSAGSLEIKEDPFLGLKGLWTSLSVSDLDGDGRLDILAGNLGLNSPYQVSAEEPIRLWYTNNRSEDVRLFETISIDGKEWPRLEKWRLERRFPEKKTLFGSNENFTKLSLNDIFTTNELQDYEYKEINELRSGIFWQNADGSFEFQSLPPFSQSGRAMSSLVADFNGDGRDDIVLSLQPRYPDIWSENVEKGHLAVLLNQGARQFTEQLPHTSGLIIDGSPRGLAWGDLDGDEREELLVYLSEGQPKIFRRSSVSED